MNNTNILVIGSNSFSGSHFVLTALNAGNKVWGVSRSPEPDPIFLPYRWMNKTSGIQNKNVENFKFHRIDLNYDLKKLLELVNEIRPSIIVNFAAQGMVAESWLKPNHWYQTNVLSQVALHDELRKLEYLKKYVHVTTPEVYGSTDRGWIKEDERFTPSTPYAVSRAACDLHLMSFHKAYGFPVVFTRAANVYGPGQQLYRIIPRAMLSGRIGKKLPLHGGGTSKRCFIHIRDAMQATLMLANEAGSGTTWHLSTKEPISIKNLVENICEKVGANSKDIIEETGDRLGKDQSYLLDSKSIRQKFNWNEKVSLAEGLSETLDWVDTNLEKLARMPWSYTHKA